MIMRTTKGITPVIAIVLLLLVTVGAVGVVYTQFQDLVQDDLGADFLEEIDDIEVQTVLRNDDADDDTMELRLQNSGENEYNLSDIARVEYSVAGEDRLERGVATASFEEIEEEDTHECFTDEASDEIMSFGPGETANCDTGVTMVSPDDVVTIHLVEDESGEEFESYDCSPSTSESTTC